MGLPALTGTILDYPIYAIVGIIIILFFIFGFLGGLREEMEMLDGPDNNISNPFV